MGERPAGQPHQRPAKGDVFASTVGEARKLTIPRRDVGNFISEALGSTLFLRQSVALSG